MLRPFIALFLSSLLLLFCRSASPLELDEQYYPARLQWYAIDDAFAENHYLWQHGQYLRLHFDETPEHQGKVWLQGEGGLFKQIRPRKFDKKWLIERQSEAPVVIKLEGFDDNYPVLIEQSKHVKAPLLRVGGETVLEDDNQVTVTRTDGAEEYTFNAIAGGLPFKRQFEGPGLFHFYFRTQWHGQYGNVNLMELAINIDGQHHQTQVLKIRPEQTFELETPQCVCRYSKLYRVSFELNDDEHQVEVIADRDVLGYWRQDGAKDAYLFDHNANSEHALNSARQDLQTELPEMYFYRNLPFATPGSIKALPSSADEPNAEFFITIQGNATDLFAIPQNSVNPPLRVMVPSNDLAARFTLVSDAGERIEMQYQPDEPNLPGVQYVQFEHSFTQVRVENRTNTAFDINLGYKNTSEYTTDEVNFITLVSKQKALQALAYLQGEPAALYSILLQQELDSWRERFAARAQSLVERTSNAKLVGSLERVMQNLGSTTGTQIDSLAKFIEVMNAHELDAVAKRWLLNQAMMARSDLQQQAEQLLLDDMALAERWFDIEGYWAYRWLHLNETDALIELARVLLRQNLFAMAAKLFWLINHSQGQLQQPAEALMAAHLAQYPLMVAKFEQAYPQISLSKHWYYWQPAEIMQINDSKGVLLHNLALDTHIETFALKQDVASRIHLSGPGRYKLTIYPSKVTGKPWADKQLLDIRFDDIHWRYELEDLHDSLSLAIVTPSSDVVGSPKTVVFEVPEGIGQIQIQLSEHDGLISLARQTDVMADWAVAKGAVYIPNRRLGLTLPADCAMPSRAILDLPDHQWQRLQTVAASAGSRLLSLERWQGLSPKAKLQQALFTSDVLPNERLIGTQGTEVLAFELAEPRQLTLNIREMQRFGYPVTEAKVVFEQDGKKNLLNLPVERKISLSPGVHELRLSLANEQGFYQGKAIGQNAGTWAFYQVEGVKMPDITRRFEVATEQQPLVIEVPQSSWLRIDKHQGQSNLQYFAQPTRLELRPEAGEQEALFRVYRWQKNQSPKLEPPSDPFSVADPLVQRPPVVWPLAAMANLELVDIYEADEQQEGTWGLFGGYRARRNFDENEQTAKERFYELGWAYLRHIPDWRLHLSGDLSLRRHRDTGLETLVAQSHGLWRQSRFWQYHTTLNLYHQYRAPEAAIEGGTSVYASTGMTWKQYWQEDTNNRLTLSLFSRYLSLDEGDIYPLHLEGQDNGIIEDGRSVDDDVYSDYKEDNPYGLVLSDTWQWEPYLDTRIRLSGAINSDKHFNLLSPRRMSFAAGIRQYFEPLILALDYSHVRFKRDNLDSDSSDVLKRNALRLGLTFEHWRPLGQLGQLEVFATSDLDSGESAFGIQLNWFFSQGQGYDDFVPSRLVFPELRKRMSHHKIQSNKVISSPDE